MTLESIPTTLLPVPRSVRDGEGSLKLRDPLLMTVEVGDDRVVRAADRLAKTLGVEVRRAPFPRGTVGTGLTVRARNDPSRAETYRVSIGENRIDLVGGDAAGAFYGLQTLAQVSRREGRNWRRREIEDGPDLPLRGLLLDVSRGKIPTLDRLLRLVDQLASVKINHLQLYVEHTFDFRFDPDIARGCSPLTADEIRALDVYCRDRFIELTPSLASFGHMGRILSLPQYEHLGEISATQPWESQPWPTRLRGLTLDARNPESRQLVERMFDEFLPLFSNDRVNVNGDETHDLGRGRNRGWVKTHGRGRLYVDHLRFLASVCREHGKRAMFWGDVIRHYADLLPEIPQDAALLDWGYERDSEFAALRSPGRGKRDVIVCPGTSGWNRLISGLNNAEINIRRAAQRAHEHAATGLIVTEWGDDGHFNLLSCSMPAIFLAASCAWNNRGAGDDVLDRAMEFEVFGPGADGLLDAVRDACRAGDQRPTWRLLYRRIDSELARELEMLDAHNMDETATRCQSLLKCATGLDRVARQEWTVALHAHRLLAHKARVARHWLSSSRHDVGNISEFAGAVQRFRDEYSQVWRAHNRPSRLQDVESTLRDLCESDRLFVEDSDAV